MLFNSRIYISGIPIFWRTEEEVINSKKKGRIYGRVKKNVHQGI